MLRGLRLVLLLGIVLLWLGADAAEARCRRGHRRGRHGCGGEAASAEHAGNGSCASHAGSGYDQTQPGRFADPRTQLPAAATGEAIPPPLPASK